MGVLMKLSMEDVGRVCCCCRAFRSAAAGKNFWKNYCEMNWLNNTTPSEWICPCNTPHIPNMPQPTDYKCDVYQLKWLLNLCRALGMLLSQLDSFIGFWRGPVDSTTGGRDVFSFVWMSDCIACFNLASPAEPVMQLGSHHAITGWEVRWEFSLSLGV